MTLKIILTMLLLSVLSIGCTTHTLEQMSDSTAVSQTATQSTIVSDLENASTGEALDIINTVDTFIAPKPPHLNLCNGSEPPSITTLDVRQMIEFPEPAPRMPFRDPVFGSCVIRVTDRLNDLAAYDHSSGMKNEYSRVQSFNADGSRFLIRSLDAFWYIYDTISLQSLGITPISVDPRWDSLNPDLIYYFEGTQLNRYNIRQGSIETLHDFSTDFPGISLAAVWTRYEGSPSLDSSIWGLIAEDNNWQPVALLVYNLADNRVISKLDLSPGLSINSVTISPLGNYLLVYFDNYCKVGTLGSFEQPCGLMVYDRNLQSGRGLLRIVGHSDTALDIKRNEVLIYQDIDTDYVSMLDIASGDITNLFPIDFSHTAIGFHFSGRAFNRPGWAVVSTYNGGHPLDSTWMDDVIMVVELKKQGQKIRLAHSHSLYSENMEHDYWAEPQASSNQDLTRILFTSNWGRSETEEVEAYLITMPQDWSQQFP